MALCSYGGVAFDVVGQSEYRSGEWMPREYRIVRTAIPYSNTDDLQDGGRGNSQMAVAVVVYSDADWAAILAAQGLTQRSLTIYGRVDASVMLVGIESPRRHAWKPWWFATLTFEREG